MSLLDRVQRRAEETGGVPHPAAVDPARDASAAADAPAENADSPLPGDATATPGPGTATTAPTGWQVRHAPPVTVAEPESLDVPEPPAPIPVRVGVDAAALPASAGSPGPLRTRTSPPLMTRTHAPAEASEAPRQASLLNRTGLTRGALAKAGGGNLYAQLRGKVHQRLIEELAGSTDSTPPDQVRQRIAELVNEMVAEQSMSMTRQDKMRVIDTVIDDVLGLGPLEGLLHDPDITEIMINSPKQIYIEQHGKLSLSPVTFESNDQLMQVIDRIVSTIGRRVDESSPMVDARLKDGSRVNVIIPPLALRGPTVTIRKFAKEAFTVDDLVAFGSMTEDMVIFMRACVRGRLNVVVSGGTGSGKTTTLNILSGFIPEDERIVTIEDAAELQLRQDHVVTLETRPANIEGRGRVTIRELVINALRMRPDRIVIGECRGGEALDMLQAMNTGHDGSLTTLHANNPRDCVARLETLVLMAGAELPSRAIREQIGSAVNVIVQQSRLRDGTRKVVSITEVVGCVGGEVQLNEIFTFRQSGIGENGAVLGFLTPTGATPHYIDYLSSEGQDLPPDMFAPIRVVNEA